MAATPALFEGLRKFAVEGARQSSDPELAMKTYGYALSDIIELLATVSINRTFGSLVEQEDPRGSSSNSQLQDALMAVDPQLAAEAVQAWSDKMASLLDMPEEFITEKTVKTERYPLIAGIGVALMRQAMDFGWNEQRINDVGLGAKLALSVLTEIAETQALPPEAPHE